jgi:hypothetical protein
MADGRKTIVRRHLMVGVATLALALHMAPALAAQGDESDAGASTNTVEPETAPAGGGLTSSDSHSVDISAPAAEAEGQAAPATPAVEREDLVERRVPEDAAAKVVFLTSETYDGKEVGDGSPEGGAAGGDAHCQRLAEAAGLEGDFRAWLSDWDTSPAERFNRPSEPLVLVDRTLVSDDWADLTDGQLDHLIDLDEYGRRPETWIYAWTGTRIEGESSIFHCNAWKNRPCRDCLGTVGLGELSHEPNKRWTAYTTAPCSFKARLYCFQQ